MSVFKDHKISLKQVLDFIPEALLIHLFCNHEGGLLQQGASWQENVLPLLFCIFDNEKNERTLEDTFNSGFKALFGLGEKEKSTQKLHLGETLKN